LVRETALVPARLQRRKVGRGDDVSQSGQFKKPGETALYAHAQKLMPRLLMIRSAFMWFIVGHLKYRAIAAIFEHVIWFRYLSTEEEW